MSSESLVDGVLVFAAYGFGMTIVLLALTVSMALARTSIVRFLRGAQPYISRVSGGLVALAGAYVAYYGWLATKLNRPGVIPSSNITDTVYGWSSSATQWIDRVGSVRIAVTVALLLAGTFVAVRVGRTRRDSVSR